MSFITNIFITICYHKDDILLQKLCSWNLLSKQISGREDCDSYHIKCFQTQSCTKMHIAMP